ncbi:Periplasmic pH-dependent serine endoprotease DegQ [archaeon HR06]|nr:Periplasmic pH-dependent serine endoprotease DegQ [archaeon HR06]
MNKKALLFSSLLVSLLVVSLVYNIFLTLEVKELSERINSLSNDYLSKISELKEDINGIKSISKNVVNFSFNSLADLYDNVKESVVSIRVITRFGPFLTSGLGSGFIYKDYVITNYHVVAEAQDIEVVFYDGEGYKAEIVGKDPFSDLAVLKINTNRTLKSLSLGDSSKLRVGDPVIAIGNPFGLSGSLTFGIISQLGRTLETQTNPSYRIPNVIQIDANINPGNSGGPLLNLKGEVVGITTAIESLTGQSAGIGYAIPSNTIEREINDLITKGKYDHPYLGIYSIDLTVEIAKAMNSPYTKGVLIVEVIPNSPAAKAGLKGGDKYLQLGTTRVLIGGDIIVKINGKEIRNGDDLSYYLEEFTRPNMTINITIVRDGKEMEVKVTLGVRPEAPVS